MKKIIIRIAVLMLVFTASIFVIAKVINRGTPDTMAEMAKATFPLVYMTTEGTQLNLLHGYRKEMDVTAMRDSLTPLESDRVLNIQVQPFENKINGISFEVMTSDGKRSLEKTKVNKVEEDRDYINATLEMQNKMLINTEYILKIQVTAGTRDLYYYTRIIYQNGLHTKDYLDFAAGFYERCINKNETVIAEYIELDENADNTTLASMNIHVSTDQLIWADLNPQIYYKPTPSIKEINATTATLVLDYMISASDENGAVEYYNVSEYYRLRYTDTRILLLNFERTTREIFNPEHDVITEKGINLGIAGREISYKNDLDNKYFAFVQEGALWMFDVAEYKITQVFSFVQSTDSDARDTYGQNDISIINIDSDGNMYFLVCGYMNRGRHEGESGVAVYYFDAAASSINECLFVDTEQSYELLKKDIQSLSYVTEERDAFYIMVDRQVYGVDMASRQVQNIVTDIKAGCHASSASGKRFAWLEDNQPYNSKTINIMDLDTKEMQTISCGENERIRPLGFIDEDLAYGIASVSDINADHEGNEMFPMKRLSIVNAHGETVKEYAPDNIYVTGVEIDEKVMTLTRVTKNGQDFTEAAEDHIVGSVADEESSYGLTTQVTERKQTETILRVGRSLKPGNSLQLVKSREVLFEGSRVIVLSTQEEKDDVYYVYAKGKLDSIYTSANMAVKQADELLGVVVDQTQQTIWERGNQKTKIDLDVNSFPPAFLQYDLNVSKLQNAMDKKVLDLSGCTLEMVLYYVSEGLPVMAQTSEGPVIIGGYDEFNTRLLYQGEEGLQYYGMDDSEEMFEQAGNIFVTYLDPLTDETS